MDKQKLLEQFQVNFKPPFFFVINGIFISYQEITGIEDVGVCKFYLDASDWDMQVSKFENSLILKICSQFFPEIIFQCTF